MLDLGVGEPWGGELGRNVGRDPWGPQWGLGAAWGGRTAGRGTGPGPGGRQPSRPQLLALALSWGADYRLRVAGGNRLLCGVRGQGWVGGPGCGQGSNMRVRVPCVRLRTVGAGCRATASRGRPRRAPTVRRARTWRGLGATPGSAGRLSAQAPGPGPRIFLALCLSFPPC